MKRHVHEADALAHRAVLGRPVVEPVLPTPGQLVDARLDALGREPVGALPAADVAEVGALLDEPVVDRATA